MSSVPFDDGICSSSSSVGVEVTSSTLDCAICMDPSVFPVELPCKHIFCYLCIKGVATQAAQQGQDPTCSICRRKIPMSVLSHPRLKDASQLYKNSLPDEYHWYYEARSGGWWQFEERLTQDLEKAFLEKEKKCQLLIAGQMYEVDFEQMIQYRQGNQHFSRKIKRDLGTSQKKGIAGIRISSSALNENSTPIQPTQQAIPSALVDSRRMRSMGVTDETTVSSGDDEEEAQFFSSSEDDDEMGLEEEEDEEETDEMNSDSEVEEIGDLPRDGARAPTSRSNRSVECESGSSLLQTPPPPSAPVNKSSPPPPSSASPSTHQSSGSSLIIVLNSNVRIMVDSPSGSKGGSLDEVL